jgi:plastocyanin
MRKSLLLDFFVSKPFLLLVGLVLLPQLLLAQWTATIGAQSSDLGKQALAFLPNEIWIHAGDSITWTMAVDEKHTVSFLTTAQVRPPFAIGCPGFSSSPATFDGSTCVTTPPLANGQAFTVMFPTAGNFKLVCLVHPDMTGTVHVLAAGQSLPHNQNFYFQQGRRERAALLFDLDSKPKHQMAPNTVVTGGGEVSATAGGTETLAIMRFDQHSITIRAGHTVEWNNVASSTPHTITFGTEPANLIPPSANVTTDADGALHGVVASTSDNVHSGFIQAAPQDRIGLAQAPVGVTRFRVTFPNAGTYSYICALHDGLGMTGKVIVIP